MKKIAFFLLIVVSYVGVVQAEQFKKPYFNATKVGTWAKYEMTDKSGIRMTYTYKRLADSDGRIVFEHTSFVNSGPGKGGKATTLYVLEPGFDFARNMLSYGTAIQAMISQNNDGEPNVTTDQVIKIIRENSVDFSKSMAFKQSDKVDKYQCDHYAYNATSGGPRPMTHIGNIWLNEKIPFGVVKQSAIIKDNSKKVGDFNYRLLDFGIDAKGVPALLAKIPKDRKSPEKKQPEKSKIKSYSLKEAYEKEKVRLKVEVDERSGGKRLFIVIKNQAKHPIFLTVPKGLMDIEASPPVNTLKINIDSAKSIKLNPGQSSPALEVGQTGKRGCVKGRFELTIYKGEALITGSVTKATIK
jgi:hypothetical protein